MNCETKSMGRKCFERRRRQNGSAFRYGGPIDDSADRSLVETPPGGDGHPFQSPFLPLCWAGSCFHFPFLPPPVFRTKINGKKRRTAAPAATLLHH
ncbi:hypothetical protein niasHT_025299 [Heterodera trifolii]|uniref:Uncharacterized protein n=1 Tax=Heterodera trifolii TaxID=157864 RepID=A0ABD2KAA1_9BILA